MRRLTVLSTPVNASVNFSSVPASVLCHNNFSIAPAQDIEFHESSSSVCYYTQYLTPPWRTQILAEKNRMRGPIYLHKKCQEKFAEKGDKA